ncbi:MAG: KH domain-containing protein [Thermoleophilia bacterium]|nr:KH domain-containing protein [Thermoleophilia bacterium]
MTSAEGEPSSLQAEGTGETVGEAKWAALRELERRAPGLDKASVRFQVLSEGERGLLGIGQVPARVRAEVAAHRGTGTGAEAPGSAAAELRDVVERICAGLEADASVSVAEAEGVLVARLAGPDVALVIGKRGQTIDAIQHLANAVLSSDDAPRPGVVVDAAGYRRRRQVALERAAEAAAREAQHEGVAVALEPMSAPERKLVHLYLKGRGGVSTTSEGAEPHRRVVVSPSAPG